MLDDAGRHQLRGRIHDAADHALAWNLVVDRAARIDAGHARPRILAAEAVKVPVRDAVLHGNDHRLGAKQLRHIAGYRFNLMRLHCQHDHVLSTRFRIVVARPDSRHNFFGAIGIDQPDAAGAERLETRSACDEGDVLSGQRKPSPHIAADCTDSNDRYLHGLHLSGGRLSTAARPTRQSATGSVTRWESAPRLAPTCTWPPERLPESRWNKRRTGSRADTDTPPPLRLRRRRPGRQPPASRCPWRAFPQRLRPSVSQIPWAG